MPEISIIIPVYNTEQYLGNSLKSLINQTFKDIEIICINDASTDNSLQILESFARQDNRIVILNQKNSGVAAARNNGLYHATGKYIMFCDSDDFYEPNMCEVMLKTMLDNKLDIVKCSTNVFIEDKSNRNINLIQNYQDGLNKTGIFSLNDCNNKLLFGHDIWNKIFKKSIIDNYYILFPEKTWCEDRAFIMKYLAVSGKAQIIADKLYNYRLSNNSLCENLENNNIKNFYDSVLVMKDVKEFYNKYNLLEKNKDFFINKINFSITVYYKSFDNLHKKDFVEKHKKLIDDIKLDEIILQKYPIIAALNNKGVKYTMNLLENKDNVNVLQNLFSLKNKNKHKVLRIAGIKIKLKHPKFKSEKITEQENHQLNTLQKIYRQNDELFKGMIFNNLIQNKDWVKNKDFIPTKGAATYSFLYILLLILDKIQPQNILEFGLGQTTKLTAQYAKFKNPNCNLQTIDHDENWINIMKEELPEAENINIIKRDLESFDLNNSANDKYYNLQEITENVQYDLIIIDGPFGFNRTYPRTNILDLIPQNLANDFIIILDDAERIGEKNTAKLIFEKLDSNNIKYGKFYQEASKTQLIIYSEKYQFLKFY